MDRGLKGFQMIINPVSELNIFHSTYHLLTSKGLYFQASPTLAVCDSTFGERLVHTRDMLCREWMSNIGSVL